MPKEDTEMQLYRPRGKVEIPKGLRNTIRTLTKGEFDSLRRLIIDKGYSVFAGDCTRQSISYPDYALDGFQALMAQGQFVAQGSLYDYTKGRDKGWKCPLIKVNACNRGKINALEKRVGIKKGLGENQ